MKGNVLDFNNFLESKCTDSYAKKSLILSNKKMINLKLKHECADFF